MEDRWNRFQHNLDEMHERRRRRRYVAICILGSLFVAGFVAARIAPLFEVPHPRVEQQVKEIPPSSTCRDVLCKISWPAFELGEDGVYEEWVENHRVVYTVDPELQEEALAVLRRYKVHYGAFVAVEPSTGRILALAEYSHDEPDMKDFCRRATYPAASLIKIITAAAALQTGRVNSSTEIRFEGSPYRLYPRKINPSNRWRENNVHSLAEAFGKSNNVVFAKLGVDQVGPERLESSLEHFGFNRAIPFDFPIQESRAVVTSERYTLARTAAGFGDVYLSPIHAALIGAAVGNEGVMMQPYVVDSIEGVGGETFYKAAPLPFARCVPGPIAEELGDMMEQTVTNGTSSKVFYRYARKLRREVGVVGKTGSLSGSDPPGKYEWFVGFAPKEAPEIAVASLVVNRGDLWHIKGTYVAQAVMREFFGM